MFFLPQLIPVHFEPQGKQYISGRVHKKWAIMLNIKTIGVKVKQRASEGPLHGPMNIDIPLDRDGKTYKRASNACVIFF